jgi:hypothetical protein
MSPEPIIWMWWRTETGDVVSRVVIERHGRRIMVVRSLRGAGIR